MSKPEPLYGNVVTTRQKQALVDQMLNDMQRAGKKVFVFDGDGTLFKVHTCHDRALAHKFFNDGTTPNSLFSSGIKDEVTPEQAKDLFADHELLTMLLSGCKERGIKTAIASKQSYVSLKGLLERSGIKEEEFTAGIHGNPYPNGKIQLTPEQQAAEKLDPIKGRGNGGNKGGFMSDMVAVSKGELTLEDFVYCDDAELNVWEPKRAALEQKGIAVFGGAGEMPALEGSDFKVEDENGVLVSYVNGNYDASPNGLNFDNMSKLASKIAALPAKQVESRTASAPAAPAPVAPPRPKSGKGPAVQDAIAASKAKRAEASAPVVAEAEVPPVVMAVEPEHGVLPRREEAIAAAARERAKSAPAVGGAVVPPPPAPRPVSAPPKLYPDDSKPVSKEAVEALVGAQKEASNLSSKKEGIIVRFLKAIFLMDNNEEKASKVMARAVANFANSAINSGRGAVLDQEGLDAIPKDKDGKPNLAILGEVLKAGPVKVSDQLKVGGEKLGEFLEKESQQGNSVAKEILSESERSENFVRTRTPKQAFVSLAGPNLGDRGSSTSTSTDPEENASLLPTVRTGRSSPALNGMVGTLNSFPDSGNPSADSSLGNYGINFDEDFGLPGSAKESVVDEPVEARDNMEIWSSVPREEGAALAAKMKEIAEEPRMVASVRAEGQPVRQPAMRRPATGIKPAAPASRLMGAEQQAEQAGPDRK